jgi:hypothetical protein
MKKIGLKILMDAASASGHELLEHLIKQFVCNVALSIIKESSTISQVDIQDALDHGNNITLQMISDVSEESLKVHFEFAEGSTKDELFLDDVLVEFFSDEGTLSLLSKTEAYPVFQRLFQAKLHINI